MNKIKTEEVGGNITLCAIASCFGLVMFLGDFVPSSGVALVLFIMVGLMLSYLTSLQPEIWRINNECRRHNYVLKRFCIRLFNGCVIYEQQKVD